MNDDTRTPDDDKELPSQPSTGSKSPTSDEEYSFSDTPPPLEPEEEPYQYSEHPEEGEYALSSEPEGFVDKMKNKLMELLDPETGIIAKLRSNIQHQLQESEEPFPASLMTLLKTYALPLIIGVLFIGFAGYKLLGLFVSRDTQTLQPAATTTVSVQETKQTAKEITAPPVSSALIPKTPTETTPTDTTPKLTPTHTTTPKVTTQETPEGIVITKKKDAPKVMAQQGAQLATVFNSRVKDLETKTAQAQHRVEALDASLSKLNNAVRVLYKNQQTLAKRIDTTAAQLKTHEAHAATTAPAPEPTEGVQVTPTAPPQYYVQAVVPERAWLVGDDGKTVTVKVGDLLLGYGRIVHINSNEAIVSTTSGKMITYKGQ